MLFCKKIIIQIKFLNNNSTNMNLEKYYRFLENQVYMFLKYKHALGLLPESLADGKKITVNLKVM
jgi:hypothetical protein